MVARKVFLQLGPFNKDVTFCNKTNHQNKNKQCNIQCRIQCNIQTCVMCPDLNLSLCVVSVPLWVCSVVLFLFYLDLC